MVEWTIGKTTIVDGLAEKLNALQKDINPFVHSGSLSRTLASISSAIATPRRSMNSIASMDRSQCMLAAGCAVVEDRKGSHGHWIILLRDSKDLDRIMGIRLLFPDGIELLIDVVLDEVEMKEKR